MGQSEFDSPTNHTYTWSNAMQANRDSNEYPCQNISKLVSRCTSLVRRGAIILHGSFHTDSRLSRHSMGQLEPATPIFAPTGSPWTAKTVLVNLCHNRYQGALSLSDWGTIVLHRSFHTDSRYRLSRH
jgi:hypothetical protein